MPIPNLPDQQQTSGTPSGLRKYPHITITVIVVFILYLGLNVWIYFYGTKLFTFLPFVKKAAETVSVVKQQGFGVIVPTGDIYPLPTGIQQWNVEYAPDMKGPKIQNATVDPLTPKKGEAQTITLVIKSNSPLTSAKATLVTDNGNMSGTFKRVSGSPTDGTWSLVWRVNDSYDHTYRLNMSLVSTTGSWNGDLPFR